MAGKDLLTCFPFQAWTKIRSGLCVILALVIFAFCLLGCKPAKTQTGPREKVTIAHWTGPSAALMHIALAKGYFAEEGLDASSQPHAFGKLALNAVIEGKADIATAGDTPIVFAVMNGKMITILATIQTANKNEAIVARRDRGITGPADLKGKRIGVTLGTTGHFFLDSFLLAHGIESKQFTLVDMKPDEMVAALGSGRVDAVSAFNPTVKQLEKSLGSNGTVFFGESLYTEIFCVAATQEFVKKNPEAVKKFLRALLKAETFIKEHPEEAQNLVADFIKMDKTELADIWNILTFKVTLDQALLVDFEDQTRWMLKNKLAPGKQMPNYLEYIHAEGLNAVKPDAVRIVR